MNQMVIFYELLFIDTLKLGKNEQELKDSINHSLQSNNGSTNFTIETKEDYYDILSRNIKYIGLNLPCVIDLYIQLDIIYLKQMQYSKVYTLRELIDFWFE